MFLKKEKDDDDEEEGYRGRMMRMMMPPCKEGVSIECVCASVFFALTNTHSFLGPLCSLPHIYNGHKLTAKAHASN